ncbi:uncharacterized protein LOC135467761 [Liolophura sinensis]|uniref:uncharacterized protein LOC135467761 n=1 Tax=Liolophura sinensis TaxID=3198878 RepID=UPI003159384E
MDEWLYWVVRKHSVEHRFLSSEDHTIMQLNSQMEMRATLLGLIFITLMTLDMVLCRQSCNISPKLRDKWFFKDRKNKGFMRIRAHALIYVNKENNTKIRYKCLERRGNIYLLRTHRTPKIKNGVLCLGFSYLGVSPYEGYGMLRLNSNGDSFSLISPKPVNRNTPIEIDTSCDLLYGSRRQAFAFIRRAGSGCRFPKKLRGEWDITYIHALKAIFTPKTLIYHLVDRSTLSLHCDKRDGNLFLLRAKNYNNSTMDAIVCFKITPLTGSAYYSYELSRLNSGHELDNQLRLIPADETAHIHQTCNWIDSPGRPEFLYH